MMVTIDHESRSSTCDEHPRGGCACPARIGLILKRMVAEMQDHPSNLHSQAVHGRNAPTIEAVRRASDVLLETATRNFERATR